MVKYDSRVSEEAFKENALIYLIGSGINSRCSGGIISDLSQLALSGDVGARALMEEYDERVRKSKNYSD